jgi:RNA polymerase sigma-70 factor (ECF subfamily)
MAVLDCQLSPTDSDIVERVRGGDICLFELLMRRYNQRLFRLIRSVNGDDSEAEDILQDTWVNAFEHLGQFEGRASFATWLTKIALHGAIRGGQRRKRWVALEDGAGETMANAEHLGPHEGDPEIQAIRGEVNHLLQVAVDRLPDAYRSVFVLREVEQMSTAETAEWLNLSEEAVKTRLHRSRSLLRKDLQNRLGPAILECYSFLGPRCDRTVAAVLKRICSNASLGGLERARPRQISTTDIRRA